AKESGKIASIDWRFEPVWLAICLLALVAFQWCHIEIWRLMLRALGGEIEVPLRVIADGERRDGAVDGKLHYATG
ncbi:MAG: hypothetical protein ABR591_15900, partial [Candidatus Velthaea sp.]